MFQETYHKKTYEKLHPSGPKSNYAYHTEAMDRAMDGGIDDVGIGVLFGLELYRYELVGLLMHAEHLEAAKGVGPHTISVPRIRPAEDINLEEFTNAISDKIFETAKLGIPLGYAWLGAITYAFVIYFDFSGYTDMAIGLCRVFGFHIGENFDYPYMATSIQDFWRRWHISLTSWFRDYIYIPLGGNRKGKKKTYRNLIIIYLYYEQDSHSASTPLSFSDLK